MSCGACWTEFGAVCWQPTGLMGPCWAEFGLCVGHVLRDLLDRVWACMLGTYKSWSGLSSLVLYVGNLLVLQVWLYLGNLHSSQEACWSEFGAWCWQPTSLMGPIGPSLVLYVGNPSLMGPVGPSLVLYAGNLQVLWGLLDWVWDCMLRTYRSYRAYLAKFGAVCWQPT